MKALLVKRPRRQLLAAGVLLWTSLTLAWGNELSLKEHGIACISTTPSHTYKVSLTVGNGMDCSMGWITLHSNHNFSPHIINLTNPVASGNTSTFTTTLTGPVPGTTHNFVLMAHCYEGGEICKPCRLEIKLELPDCDPTIDPPNPDPRPRPPRAFGLDKERFFLSLPEAASRPTPMKVVVEASEDMETWRPVAFSTSASAEPSMEAVDAETNSPSNRTLWVTKEKAKHCLFYRVRETPSN